MKKLIIAVMLLISAVFSLSADEFKSLKKRHVGGLYERPANIYLFSNTTEAGTVYYGVLWAEGDGSDIVNFYECSSIEHAFNVWNMSRDEIESKRQFMKDEAIGLEDDNLFLLRYYTIK